MIAEHGQHITSPSGHAFNAAAAEAAIECEDQFGHVNCNPFCSGRLRAPPTGALPYLQQDGHACGSYMTSGSYCVSKSPQSAPNVDTSPGQAPAASRLLVASPPVQDLSVCAKYLFVAAMYGPALPQPPCGPDLTVSTSASTSSPDSAPRSISASVPWPSLSACP